MYVAYDDRAAGMRPLLVLRYAVRHHVASNTPSWGNWARLFFLPRRVEHMLMKSVTGPNNFNYPLRWSLFRTPSPGVRANPPPCSGAVARVVEAPASMARRPGGETSAPIVGAHLLCADARQRGGRQGRTPFTALSAPLAAPSPSIVASAARACNTASDADPDGGPLRLGPPMPMTHDPVAHQ